jgi:hypothetical protein
MDHSKEINMSRSDPRFPSPFATAAAALLAALALLAPLPAAAAPDDAQPVLAYVRYEDTFNRGQIDVALDQFTDDAFVIAGPGCTPQAPCVGKAAIRDGLLARFVAQNIAVRIREVHFDGQYLRSKVEVSFDALRKLGFARLVGNDNLEFRGGKIASLIFVSDRSDGQTLRWLTPPTPEKKP